MKIQSADLVKYNANERGKNVGDCVKRSLSLAFGMDYNNVGKELMNKVKEVMPKSYARGEDSLWKRSGVYDKVIADHGGIKHPHSEIDGLYTLEEFVDNVLPEKGTFLVTTGRKPETHDHIVCVIDGTVYDSWDSRDQYPYCYYSFGDDFKVERGAEIDIANLSEAQIEGLLDKANYYDRIAQKAYKMLEKAGYKDAKFDVTGMAVIHYKISTNCRITFPPSQYTGKIRNYSFKLELVCSPFETKESFNKLIEKVVNVRTYDRVYAILQNEKQEQEGEEVLQARMGYASDATKKRLSKTLYMLRNEQKLYDSLPGWARALTTYIDINQPGEFSDSYEIHLVPLPGDPYNDEDDFVIITAFDAQELRRKLQEYHDTFKVTNDY